MSENHQQMPPTRWLPSPALSKRAIAAASVCVCMMACAPVDDDPETKGSGGAGLGGGISGPVVAGSSGSGSVGISGEGGSVAITGGTGGSDAGGSAVGGSATGGSNGGDANAGGVTGSGGGAGGSPNGMVAAVPLDPSLMSRCTGSNPIKCTIPVAANGNYNLTVELGSAQAASTSQVEAELYRIVLPATKLAAGAFSQQTFSVNVRAEDHDDYDAPGKELNILIDGAAPALHGLGYVAANLPTLFVVGDSTVCDAPSDQRGWAQEFSQFLRPGLAVANYADAGDTAGTLYGKFASRGAVLKEGDYLFIQFGHNDQKTQAGVDSYKANLMKFITDARSAKATPILFSPVARRAYLDDHNKPTTLADPGFAGLDGQARDLAAAEHVAFVDLTKLALNYYATVNASTLFAGTTEIAHFNVTGATAISKLVADALKAGTTPVTSIADFLK
jgi:lysophospholipase L1-like esterase